MIGIDASAGLGTDGRLSLFNSGLIEGTGGTAIRAGGEGGSFRFVGDSEVVGDVVLSGVRSDFTSNQVDLGGSIDGDLLLADGSDFVRVDNLRLLMGDVRFFGGDDVLSLDSFLRDAPIDGFVGGGDGALFDLGEGTDLIRLGRQDADAGFATTDVAGVVLSDAFARAATITLVDGDTTTMLRFAGAERFAFRDGELSFDALLALAGIDAEVPLPAAAWLFGGAMGLGGLVRRGRR